MKRTLLQVPVAGMLLLAMTAPASDVPGSAVILGTLTLSEHEALCPQGHGAAELRPVPGTIYWSLDTSRMPLRGHPPGAVFDSGTATTDVRSLVACGQVAVSSTSYWERVLRAACVSGRTSQGTGTVALHMSQGAQLDYHVRDLATRWVAAGQWVHALSITATGSRWPLTEGQSGSDRVDGSLLIVDDGSCLGGRGKSRSARRAAFPVTGRFSIRSPLPWPSEESGTSTLAKKKSIVDFPYIVR